MEFALLLPLLLTVLFGTVEFGRLFVAYLDVVEAAHDAARVAALGGGTTSAVAAADGAAAAAGLNTGELVVNITGTPASGGGWVAGTPVTALITYTVPVVVPLLQPVLGSAFALSSAVTMQEEVT